MLCQGRDQKAAWSLLGVIPRIYEMWVRAPVKALLIETLIFSFTHSSVGGSAGKFGAFSRSVSLQEK